MVKTEEVEQLMREVFPKCPICGSDAGYDVSGMLKTYVQCRHCGAKWSNPAFQNLKLEKLKLWEPAKDGRGGYLKFKEHPVSFWQSLSEEELKKTSKDYEDALAKGQILVTPEMSDEELLAGIKKDQTDFAYYFNRMTGGKGWDLFYFLLGTGSDIESRQMWMLLSLINQNKVLIRQNELIRRLLERIAESSTSVSREE